MKKRILSSYFRRKKDQRGEILLTTLIFVMLGFMIIVPLLAFMGTGLKTEKVFNQKSAALYAADAGIEDAIWQIKYDQLSGSFSTYDSYDYTSTGWNYDLPQVDGKPQVNNKNVSVTIKNLWIPVITDVNNNPYNPPRIPDKTEAKLVANSEKLIITGGAYGASSYQIVITYYPGVSETLKFNNIGVWLPPGFTYVAGSSNLEVTGKPYTKVPVTSSYNGGQKIIWSYTLPGVNYTAFPNVNLLDSPMTAKITFNYTAATFGARPDAVSWINFTGISGMTYSWDSEVRVFSINSTSKKFDGTPDTTVDSYISKSELRKMGGAVNGDYYATGNSLMTDTGSDGVRDHKTDSSAIVTTPTPAGADNGVPQDANVAASYLYWGTWYKNTGSRCANLLIDDCLKFKSGGATPIYYWDNDASSGWSITTNGTNKYFSANGNNTVDTSTYRDLTMHSGFAFNLTNYPSPTWMFTLSWEQWYTGTTPGTSDGLDFSLFNDGENTWSPRMAAFRGSGVGNSGYKSTATYQYNIPATYLTSNFRIKFHVVGFNTSGQYVNIDNIRINALNPDTGITFKIDKGTGAKIVYFDSNGNPADSTNPANQLVSTRTQVLLTYSYSSDASPSFNGFAYSCYRDVTALVKKYAEQPVDPATNFNGHATYWAVGDLGDTGEQLSHAGWSLVTIYTSPETLGHQLYLYDNYFGSRQDTNGVHVDWDGDGVAGGTISGFLVPDKIAGEVNSAKVTCFVTEGDSALSGDYYSMNGTKLWDGTNSSLNNVWNGKSKTGNNTSTFDGIDIDTLGVDPTANPPQYITWNSNILKAKDTTASIDLYTESDYWFMVYMILSFRSATSTGGSLSYLIHN